MPETLIIELRQGPGAATAAPTGPPRPPQLGPSYMGPTTAYPPTAVQPGVPGTAFTPVPPAPVGPPSPTFAPPVPGRGPETNLLGPITPAVNDLVMGLREARIGLGRFGTELLAASPSQWAQASPFFTRGRTAIMASTAGQVFNQEGGFAGQALGGVASTVSAFAIGGPLFAGITAFTSALRLGVEWLRHWRERLQETAESLRPFGPQLARQSAMEEARNIRQDIERARKMDETLSRFVAAQGELQRAQKDFDDRLMRQQADREIRGMERQAEALRVLADENSTALEKMQANLIAAANNQTAALVEGLKGIKAGIDRMNQDRDADATIGDFMKQLDDAARLPGEAGDPGPRAPDRNLRFPPLGAAGGI